MQSETDISLKKTIAFCKYSMHFILQILDHWACFENGIQMIKKQHA